MSVWNHPNPISQFEEARSLSVHILPRYHTYYVTMAGTLLTYLYALLGAATYGLRDLSSQLAERTWTPIRATKLWLRMVLAFVAGFVIGIFADFSQQITLSPVAAAFIVGYSVEVFFSFIDGVIGRLRTPPQATGVGTA